MRPAGRGARPGNRASGGAGAGRRAARGGAARRAVSATRRPSRPGAARPVAGRPGSAPAAGRSGAASSRAGRRSVSPAAGSRRRATALVHSPLARQIAALGLALCAVALSLAYPLRSYLHQQAAEQVAVAEQQQLQQQIADLKARQAALKDPDYVKDEARRRLQYVSPGDTVYVVKVPVTPTPPPPPADAAMPGGTAVASSDAGSAAGTAAGKPSAAANGTAVGNGAGNGTAAPAPSTTAHQPWYSVMWDTLDGHGDNGNNSNPAAPVTSTPAPPG